MKFIVLWILCAVGILHGSAQELMKARSAKQLFVTKNRKYYILAWNSSQAEVVEAIKNIDELLAEQREKSSDEPESPVASALTNGTVENLNLDLIGQKSCKKDNYHFLNSSGKPFFKGSDVLGHYEFAPTISLIDIDKPEYSVLQRLLASLIFSGREKVVVEAAVYNQQGFCQENRLLIFQKQLEGNFIGFSRSNRDSELSGFERIDVRCAIPLK